MRTFLRVFHHHLPINMKYKALARSCFGKRASTVLFCLAVVMTTNVLYCQTCTATDNTSLPATAGENGSSLASNDPQEGDYGWWRRSDNVHAYFARPVILQPYMFQSAVKPAQQQATSSAVRLQSSNNEAPNGVRFMPRSLDHPAFESTQTVTKIQSKQPSSKTLSESQTPNDTVETKANERED